MQADSYLVYVLARAIWLPIPRSFPGTFSLALTQTPFLSGRLRSCCSMGGEFAEQRTRLWPAHSCFPYNLSQQERMNPAVSATKWRGLSRCSSVFTFIQVPDQWILYVEEFKSILAVENYYLDPRGAPLAGLIRSPVTYLGRHLQIQMSIAIAR